MSTMASQITGLMIVYSIVYSGADQRKHQGSASLAFVRRIHRWPANSPHKGPVTWKMFQFDDVIMNILSQRPSITTINIIYKIYMVQDSLFSFMSMFQPIKKKPCGLLVGNVVATFKNHILLWKRQSNFQMWKYCTNGDTNSNQNTVS